jgi:predicted lipoprotein with Yx(FWY)xxD motif
MSATTLALAGLVALSLVAAACGDDEDTDDGASEPTAGTTTAAASPTTAAAADTPEPGAGIATITTADAGDLGTILTTIDGYTLYVFDNDTAGSGTSACTGGCTSAWPPLPVANPTASSDVTGELGSITRDDGSPQATYNGKPLHLFANDASPGDTNGKDVPNWSVATP